MTDDPAMRPRQESSGGDGLSVVESIHSLRLAREAIEDLIKAEVTRARAEGWSWTQIGAALGISRQGAQVRYSEVPVPGCGNHPRSPSRSALAARRAAAQYRAPQSTPFGAYRHQRQSREPDASMSPK